MRPVHLTSTIGGLIIGTSLYCIIRNSPKNLNLFTVTFKFNQNPSSQIHKTAKYIRETVLAKLRSCAYKKIYSNFCMLEN